MTPRQSTGRGVDLILYLWVCISLILLLNLHLKLRTQHELITALARRIALANVDERQAAAVTRADAADPDMAAGHTSTQTSARSA